MGKYCINCGKELGSNAKFCGRCGTKVPQISGETSPEHTANSTSRPSASYQKSQEFVSQAKERVRSVANKETVSRYAHVAKKEGLGIVNDVKNFKSLSKQRKKRLLTICVPVLVVIVAVFIFIPTVFGGPSDKVISEAALKVAEQDYGYSLELTSYEIVDKFTGKADNLMSGKKITANIALVIVNAAANDSDGNLVDEVTYGVVVVDPEMTEGYATCSPMSSCQNCTGMTTDEIASLLKEGTAHFH